ncbi:hypothetical protein YSY43_13890 [Paenibacillus sp. YSY-4.3]
MAVGEISPKDVAAEWAIPRLPKEHAALLDLARKAYRGEYVDNWEGLDSEVIAFVNHMKNTICDQLVSSPGMDAFQQFV